MLLQLIKTTRLERDLVKKWEALRLTLLGSLLATGLLLLINSPTRNEQVELLPPPSSADIMMHISGAVRKSDIHALAHISRWQQAIDAKGGLLPEADEQAFNLAAARKHGVQVRMSTSSAGAEASPVASSSLMSGIPTEDGLVNINCARQEELVTLPSIGPAHH